MALLAELDMPGGQPGEEEIRYRNATAPSPAPAPTTAATPNSPERVPRAQPAVFAAHDGPAPDAAGVETVMIAPLSCQ